LYEEVFPDIYRIEVPLPKSTLKALNAYLIKSGKRHLLIDTGLNRKDCRQALFSSLKKLHADLENIDIFITHLHSDHLGLVGDVASKTSTIYFSQRDKDMIDRIDRWNESVSFFMANGFPENELKKALEEHQGHRYRLKQNIEFTIVHEGDRIDAGDYHFTCIETPGHSPGHTCLYEADRKILFTGDHILFDITPNITFWPGEDNPLKEYLSSLEKVYPLDVEFTLPGHRRTMNNHRARVRELQAHHQARLNEIVSGLQDGDKTAFEIAPYVKWDITYSSWEFFPAPQKWFAIGETLAHIRYLEKKGMVHKKNRGNVIIYSLS
jgi:glyoxylase-like metal-dependent hydrolase (beta-lactamase superfamily II)